MPAFPSIDTASLQHLAEESLTVECALSDDELGLVADLMLRIMQRHARARGALLTQMQGRSYAERSDVEREGLRSAVKHALVALVLLGIIDMPQ